MVMFQIHGAGDRKHCCPLCTMLRNGTCSVSGTSHERRAHRCQLIVMFVPLQSENTVTYLCLSGALGSRGAERCWTDTRHEKTCDGYSQVHHVRRLVRTLRKQGQGRHRLRLIMARASLSTAKLI